METGKWAKKSKWSKFTCLTHHIRSEFGFQNLRSIVIQNGTFRRNMVTKKIVFGRMDLHRKCRPGNGRKSQNGQNSRVLPIIYVQCSDFKIYYRLLFKMESLEEIWSRKKWFLGVRIFIGSGDREMGEKVKMVKIHVSNPSYTFRVRISKS